MLRSKVIRYFSFMFSNLNSVVTQFPKLFKKLLKMLLNDTTLYPRKPEFHQ